jgi:methionine-rich copper-binding protein CopC
MNLEKAVNHRVHREKSRGQTRTGATKMVSLFLPQSIVFFAFFATLVVLWRRRRWVNFAQTAIVFRMRSMRLLDIGYMLAVLSLAFLCALPEVSWGHAFPDHSDPKVGSTMTVSPAQVRIWFDSALEPAFSTIMVQNANNEIVDKRDGRVDPSNPTLLLVSLPKLPPGLYRAMWNVVSRDGHRTSGDFSFTIR